MPPWSFQGVVAAVFWTRQGRLPVASDFEGVWATPLPLSVAVFRWVAVGVVIFAAYALTLQ